MRRFSLEKWLNEPFFETAVAGAVARVSIRGSYMMAEVLRVVEREPGVYKCAPLLGSSKCCMGSGGVAVCVARMLNPVMGQSIAAPSQDSMRGVWASQHMHHACPHLRH